MRYFFFLFFIISFKCNAQKDYHFDHLLKYQFTSPRFPAPGKVVYYLTNSKDNSYFAQIELEDSLHYKVLLREHDKLRMNVKLKKQDILKEGKLTIECSSEWYGKNDFKFRTREYEFQVTADTLIDDKSLKHYKLVYTASRRRKITNHIGTSHYIIQDSTGFHLPLLVHPTEYEEWKEEGNIPNGIFREKIFYYYKSDLEDRYILKNFFPFNKSFRVTQGCRGE